MLIDAANIAIDDHDAPRTAEEALAFTPAALRSAEGQVRLLNALKPYLESGKVEGLAGPLSAVRFAKGAQHLLTDLIEHCQTPESVKLYLDVLLPRCSSYQSAMDDAATHGFWPTGTPVPLQKLFVQADKVQAHEVLDALLKEYRPLGLTTDARVGKALLKEGVAPSQWLIQHTEPDEHQELLGLPASAFTLGYEKYPAKWLEGVAQRLPDLDASTQCSLIPVLAVMGARLAERPSDPTTFNDLVQAMGVVREHVVHSLRAMPPYEREGIESIEAVQSNLALLRHASRALRGAALGDASLEALLLARPEHNPGIVHWACRLYANLFVAKRNQYLDAHPEVIPRVLKLADAQPEPLRSETYQALIQEPADAVLTRIPVERLIPNKDAPLTSNELNTLTILIEKGNKEVISAAWLSRILDAEQDPRVKLDSYKKSSAIGILLKKAVEQSAPALCISPETFRKMADTGCRHYQIPAILANHPGLDPACTPDVLRLVDKSAETATVLPGLLTRERCTNRNELGQNVLHCLRLDPTTGHNGSAREFDEALEAALSAVLTADEAVGLLSEQDQFGRTPHFYMHPNLMSQLRLADGRTLLEATPPALLLHQDAEGKVAAELQAGLSHVTARAALHSETPFVKVANATRSADWTCLYVQVQDATGRDISADVATRIRGTFDESRKAVRIEGADQADVLAKLETSLTAYLDVRIQSGRLAELQTGPEKPSRKRSGPER